MGQRLGRYEIIRRISSGGMATVHLARLVGEGGFQRLLAVKLMHPHLAEDPEFVNMFLDEGRLAASIRHPNVVATIDIQRSPEGLFLVMDYVDGPSVARIIRHVVRTEQVFDLGILLRIFLDMLAGLDAAHELIGSDGKPVHLIHRDVSPSNILVGSDGISRITDFGIARAEARITSTRGRQLKGKLPYMAPEQLSSGGIDRRVDVYAAGCVLWEMLALRRLFQGDDEAQLLAAVLQGPTQSPVEMRSDVPWSLDRTCMRALEGLDDRYKSASQFAEAIEEAARQDGVRIASLRDVGRFVTEQFPQPAPDASDPSSVGLRGLDTPPSGANLQLHSHSPVSAPSHPSAISAVSNVSGSYPSGLHGAPGPDVPLGQTIALPGGMPDAGPTTNASVVAFPTGSMSMQRSKLAVGVAIAIGAVGLGGVMVWLASGSETDPGHDPGIQMSLDAGVEPPEPDPDPETTASTEPTAEPTVEPTSEPTTKPVVRPHPRPPPTTTRTRTKTKTKTKTKTPTPTPKNTTTQTPTEWRPPRP